MTIGRNWKNYSKSKVQKYDANSDVIKNSDNSLDKKLKGTFVKNNSTLNLGRRGNLP